MAFDPASTWSGVEPFFVGCHSRAIFGNSPARLLVTEASLPAQYGHGVSRWVRWATDTSNSWSGPFLHFHQARFELVATLQGWFDANGWACA